MKQYEYLTFERRVAPAELTKIGLDGWKLVNHSVVAQNSRVYQYYVFIREIIKP